MSSMPESRVDPLAQSDHDNTFFTRRTLVSMALLLSATFLITALILITVASQLNAHSAQQSQFSMEEAWKARENVLITHIKDNAFWGEAYTHLHLQTDIDWAYNRQNLGPTLFSDYGFEGVFVIDDSGRTNYAVTNGQLSQTSLDSWLGGTISRQLIQRARPQGNSDYKVIAGTYRVSGAPAIVAMAPLTAGGDSNVVITPGKYSYLVFVDILTPENLRRLGDDYHVALARIPVNKADAVGQPALRFAQPDGADALIIRWTPYAPGTRMLILLLPMLSLLAFILCWLANRVIRKAMANARLSDRRFFMLIESQTALAASEARFRDVAEAASDWIWETDAHLRITYLSERFVIITGYDVESWIGKDLEALLHCPTQPLSAWLHRYGRQNTLRSLRCSYLTPQGATRICAIVARPVRGQRGYSGFRGTASDITLEVEAQARIHFLSHHDALTGLPNRTQMQEFLEGKLKAMPSLKHPIVMLSVDLDHFKPINDSFGHHAGDRVLNAVSSRLRSCLREEDLVARHGGDEFVLIVSGMTTVDEVAKLCERLITEIKMPFLVNEQEVYIGASIGIAMAPKDAIHAEDLLRLADIALYQAKNEGRNTWVFYSPEMGEYILQRHQMEKDLREALKQNQLLLLYQPRYSIDKSTLLGVEALVRWMHPRLGLLSPDSFISLAEETGLVIALSNWVLNQACRDALSWAPTVIISVNISPVEFRTKGLVERVAEVIARTGLPAERLELEITENVTIENPQSTMETMQRLKALGVRLVLDDFGTGYSSINYLRSFPFNGLKIDKSFMAGFPQSPKEHSIVEGIINLGHAFSLNITAAGVETPEQLKQLKSLLCDEAQGYHLGKPMDFTHFNQYIQQDKQ